MKYITNGCKYNHFDKNKGIYMHFFAKNKGINLLIVIKQLKT